MSNFINAQEIREKIPISILLEKLGYTPVKKSGQELFYISMLRDSDTDPSFCVNDSKAVWHDKGGANSSGIQGGTIIEFGIAYWHPLSFHQILEKIKDTSGATISSVEKIHRGKVSRPRLAIKLPHYKVEEVKPLGTNPIITSYLQYRGVWNAPHDGLQEIYYYVEDEKKIKKRYFAVGWQNEAGMWEVRNKYFKGSLGKKAITFIPGDPNILVAFEGYLNYKSWQINNPGATQSILVLNSTALIAAGIQKATGFNSISIFFDNDKNGRETTEHWLLALPYSIDHAHIYNEFNDYNAMAMAIEVELRTKSHSHMETEIVRRRS